MGRKIVIVGGGISGLGVAEALQYRAKDAGETIEPIVLEGESVAGGKIRSVRQQGIVVETGPHGFLSKEPKMWSLIDRLGLNHQVIEADNSSARRFIVRKGALRELPTSPPKFLTSDILSLSGRLRVLLEPWASERPSSEESVWQFATRRIGKQAADVLIDAMVTGIYGGDPKLLSLKSAFPRMFELESDYGSLIRAQMSLAKERKQLAAKAGEEPEDAPAGGAPTGSLHSFKDGLGTITEALAATTEVRTQASVHRLERRGHNYLIHYGDGQTIEADGVVLAVPSFVASKLLACSFETQADKLKSIEYAPIAVVVQVFRREQVMRDTKGFGFLAPHLEKRQILGTIWASSVFPEHSPSDLVMFRSMVGGARSRDLVDRSEQELLQLTQQELKELVGLADDAQPVIHQVLKWQKGIPQYNLGHQKVVDAADSIQKSWPGIYLTGNGLRGVSMLNCVKEADDLAEKVLGKLSF